MKNNGTKRNASRLLIQPSIRLSKHNMEKTLQVDIDFIQTPKVKNLNNLKSSDVVIINGNKNKSFEEKILNINNKSVTFLPP